MMILVIHSFHERCMGWEGRKGSGGKDMKRKVREGKGKRRMERGRRVRVGCPGAPSS